MYATFDTQTALTFARLHQADVRASYPRRRRLALPSRLAGQRTPTAPTLSEVPTPPAPAHHRPAAA